MTTQTSENSQWYRGKTKAVTQYVKDYGNFASDVAGRNFSFRPGFLYEGQMEIEKTLKLGLSDVNYAILKETIDREIKQAGMDYDIAYRDARRQWEIDKAALFAAWEQEYAGIKMNMALEAEYLEQLAIEVSRRSALLIAAKTEIEIEMEGYKQDIEELGDDTISYEVTLAQQKLVTAQKKLEVIPILEQLIEKEAELIESETSKSEAYSALMEAEQAVADKKESDLLPKVADYATAADKLAKEIPVQTGLEVDIAGQKSEIARLGIKKAGKEIKLLEKEISVQETNLDRTQAAIDLEATKNENAIELYSLDVSNSRAVMDAKIAADAEILAKETETASVLNTNRSVEAGVKIEEKLDSAGRLYPSEIDKIARIAGIRSSEQRDVAEIQAAAKITSELIHLLEN